MQHRARKHHVREVVGERHFLHSLDAKVFRRQMTRQLPHVGDRPRVDIDAENRIALAQQIDQIAAAAAARVEHAHSRQYAPLQ
jgi:hypothetical protein